MSKSIKLPSNYYIDSSSVAYKGKALSDIFYPVGSVYISMNSTSPETLFGGTWEQIKDMFLLACGDTYSNGTSGGKAQLKLSASIGACNDNASILGYIIDGITAYQNNNSATYIVNGSGMSAFDHWNHSIPVTEYENNSRYVDNMPPYITVYVWYRTA